MGLRAFLFPEFPASFQSHFSVEESVSRLRNATDVPWSFAPVLNNKLILRGEVQATHVRLYQRGHGGYHRFHMRFEGCFEAVPKGTYLSGRFLLPTWVRLLFSGWLIGLTLFAISGFWQARNHFGATWLIPSAAMTILCLVACDIRHGQRTRNNIAQLSRIIEAVLTTR